MDPRRIYRILEEGGLPAAIEAFDTFIRQGMQWGIDWSTLKAVRQELDQLKAKYDKALDDYRRAAIPVEQWQRTQAMLKHDLLKLLDRTIPKSRMEEEVASAPSPAPDMWPPDELDDHAEEETSGSGSRGGGESPIAGSPPPEPEPSPQAPSGSQFGNTQNPFQKGKILYAIPPNMKLAEAIRCRIRIAPEALEDETLRSGLTDEERRHATEEGIRITPVMKVELVEAQAQEASFEILSRNSAEQPILPFMPTEWAFDVTPKRPGHYALLLRVSAKIQIAGFGERSFDVAVLDRAIKVTTTDEALNPVAFEEQPIPDPTWDEADDQAVYQALTIGRVDRAIERIINFVQDKDVQVRDTLILLQFRWNDNSNHLQQGIITTADWDTINNQVRRAIGGLLKELRTHFSEIVHGESQAWERLNALLSRVVS